MVLQSFASAARNSIQISRSSVTLETLCRLVNSTRPITVSANMAAPVVSEADFRKILKDNSTEHFYIEYRGFLSNHVLHGLLALRQLGATAEQLREFATWYGQKYEKAEAYKREDASGPVSELLGKRRSYYVILSHYERLLKDSYGADVARMVAGEFPKLSDGMICSALHGLIHLGYGLASKCDWFVCEALAYLHHSYLPLVISADAPKLETLGRGDMDILDVLDLVRDDKELREFMYREEKTLVWETSPARGFQRYAKVLLASRSDDIARYVSKVKFPAFYDPDSLNIAQLEKLTKWIVDCSIVVFAIASRRNDFFLLHGVTAAWSLRNIMPLLNSGDVIKVTRAFLCCFVTAYLCQDAPRLDRSKLHSAEAGEVTWKEIEENALAFRGTVFTDGRVEDEHVYKLVEVCREMGSGNADPVMERIYKMAANSITKFPYKFGD